MSRVYAPAPRRATCMLPTRHVRWKYVVSYMLSLFRCDPVTSILPLSGPSTSPSSTFRSAHASAGRLSEVAPRSRLESWEGNCLFPGMAKRGGCLRRQSLSRLVNSWRKCMSAGRRNKLESNARAAVSRRDLAPHTPFHHSSSWPLSDLAIHLQPSSVPGNVKPCRLHPLQRPSSVKGPRQPSHSTRVSSHPRHA